MVKDKKIYTRVDFKWNEETQKYETINESSYNYNGPISYLQRGERDLPGIGGGDQPAAPRGGGAAPRLGGGAAPRLGGGAAPRLGGRGNLPGLLGDRGSLGVGGKGIGSLLGRPTLPAIPEAVSSGKGGIIEDVPVQQVGAPTVVGGTLIPLNIGDLWTGMQSEDAILDTSKVTTGYFTGGGGTLDNTEIYTSSLADTNEGYYFNIAQKHPESSSVATQFSVAYGHAGGSGSLTDGGSVEGKTKAIYGQWASALLDESEVSGGFLISKAGTSGVHYSASAKDEDIYAFVGKRSLSKDRLNKKNWTIVLSGSNSVGSGSQLLHLTDDSNTVTATATVAGPRYNIVSGSQGSVQTAAATRTYGWFFPEMSAMIFSGAELSASIPGYAAGINMTASFNKGGTDASFVSCSGFAPNLSVIGNSKNALRFINCLQKDGTYLKFRSEEDQLSVSYFCRVKTTNMNFSNNPTFVSGSANEIRHRSMWGNPVTYISGIGLYGTNGQLVAIGKLSTPLKKNFNSEATIKVKLTY
jgi:hypothetical protein